MARTLRKPLPEDVDFMHASREEMASLRKAIYPLTRKLAVRLARKRRHGRRGPLDFRSTMRQSLSYGGVPADLRFKYPRPSKPEIFVVADIRSEEHTSELQSLMRNSYAVFCLKKKNTIKKS